MSTYFKILERKHSKLYSFYTDGELRLEYSTEFFTQPDPRLWQNGYGIFLYTSVKVASKGTNDGLEIWEVEAEDVKPAPTQVLSCPGATVEEALKLIESDNYWQSTITAADANYDEIVVAGKVKLLRRVYNLDHE